MTVRPQIEEETVRELNDVLESRMAVSPSSVGIDKQISVLIEEVRDLDKENQRLKHSQGTGGEWNP